MLPGIAPRAAHVCRSCAICTEVCTEGCSTDHRAYQKYLALGVVHAAQGSTRPSSASTLLTAGLGAIVPAAGSSDACSAAEEAALSALSCSFTAPAGGSQTEGTGRQTEETESQKVRQKRQTAPAAYTPRSQSSFTGSAVHSVSPVKLDGASCTSRSSHDWNSVGGVMIDQRSMPATPTLGARG